jgi:hypothetical protein
LWCDLPVKNKQPPFDAHGKASGATSATAGHMSALYANAMQLRCDNLPAGLHGLGFASTLLFGGLLIWFGFKLLQTLDPQFGFWLNAVLALPLGILLLVLNWMMRTAFRFELPSQPGDELVFDRKHGKVHRLAEGTFTVVDWRDLNVECLDKGLVLSTRKMHELATIQCTGINESTDLWEAIDNYMAGAEPQPAYEEALGLAGARKTLWNSLCLVGPFGASYKQSWVSSPAVMAGFHLFSPIWLPFFGLHAALNLLTRRLRRQAPAPETWKEKFGPLLDGAAIPLPPAPPARAVLAGVVQGVAMQVFAAPALLTGLSVVLMVTGAFAITSVDSNSYSLSTTYLPEKAITAGLLAWAVLSLVFGIATAWVNGTGWGGTALFLLVMSGACCLVMIPLGGFDKALDAVNQMDDSPAVVRRAAFISSTHHSYTHKGTRHSYERIVHRPWHGGPGTLVSTTYREVYFQEGDMVCADERPGRLGHAWISKIRDCKDVP